MGKTNCALFAHCIAHDVTGKQTLIVAGHSKTLQCQYIKEARTRPGLGRVFAIFGRNNYMCYNQVDKHYFQDSGDPFPDIERPMETKIQMKKFFNDLQEWCPIRPAEPAGYREDLTQFLLGKNGSMGHMRRMNGTTSGMGV